MAEPTPTTTTVATAAGNGRSEKLGAEHYLRIEHVRKEYDGVVAVDGTVRAGSGGSDRMRAADSLQSL